MSGDLDSTLSHWTFYLDLAASGGLGPALEAEFARANAVFDVRGFGAGGWARVSRGSRACQVCLAVQKRLFLSDFWEDGVQMGNASTGEFPEVSAAVAVWLAEDSRIAGMERRFPFFRSFDRARAFEAGRGLEYAWDELDVWVARDLPRLMPLIEAAKRRPELRQLLPFTSHESLHFSRCMGFPFTNDVAHVIPVSDGIFRAVNPDRRVMGEGSAETVITLVIESLPPGSGAAVWGTAENVRSSVETNTR